MSSENSLADIYPIIRVINMVINYGGCSVEITVIAFLLTEFAKKETTFKTAYFVVLTNGMIIDVLAIISYFFENTIGEFSPPAIAASNFLLWYSYLFLGLWNTLLAFNRLTVFMFSTKYEKVWTVRNVTIFIVVNMLFPFIINGYTLSDIHCRFFVFYEECSDYLNQFQLFTSIANLFQSIVSLAFGVITAIYARNNASSKTLHLDRILLIECIISSFSLACVSALQFYTVFMNFEDKTLILILGAVSDCIFGIYHYFGIIFLIIARFGSSINK